MMFAFLSIEYLTLLWGWIALIEELIRVIRTSLCPGITARYKALGTLLNISDPPVSQQ